MPTTGDSEWHEYPTFAEACADVLPATAPPVREMFAQVDDGYTEFAPLLKLGTPTRRLVEIYDATAGEVTEVCEATR